MTDGPSHLGRVAYFLFLVIFNPGRPRIQLPHRQWRDKLSEVTEAGSQVTPVGIGMGPATNPLHRESPREGLWQ